MFFKYLTSQHMLADIPWPGGGRVFGQGSWILPLSHSWSVWGGWSRLAPCSFISLPLSVVYLRRAL